MVCAWWMGTDGWRVLGGVGRGSVDLVGVVGGMALGGFPEKSEWGGGAADPPPFATFVVARVLTPPPAGADRGHHGCKGVIACWFIAPRWCRFHEYLSIIDKR